MINLRKISIQNFKSFGNVPTEFVLDKKGSTLILGDNQDIGERGNSKNGAAKTSLMSAVVYALYGKDIEKLKPDELVNFKNKKNMMVDLEFDVRGTSYRIVRGRKPNVLEFYVDGATLTRDSMKNTDQSIEAVLGIDYDVFLSVYFLNTFRDPFMSLGSAGQRDFLEKVLGLDVLAKRAESLKLMKKDFSVDHKLAEKDLETEVKLKEQYDDNIKWIEEKIQKFEDDRKTSIASLEKTLSSLTAIDFDYYLTLAKSMEPSPFEAEIESIGANIRVIESQVESKNHQRRMIEKANKSHTDWIKTHADALSQLESKVSQYPSLADIELRDNILHQIEGIDSKTIGIQDQQRKITNNDVPELERQQKKLEDEFAALDAGECPYCKQSHTDKDRIKEIEVEFGDIDDRIEKLGEMLSELDESLKSLFEEHDALKATIPAIPRDCTAVELSRLQDKLDDEQQKVNPYQKEDTADVVVEIDSLEQQIIDLGDQVKSLRVTDQHHQDKQSAIIEEIESNVGTAVIEKIEEKKREVTKTEELLETEKTKVNPYKTQLDEADEDKFDVAAAEKVVADIEEDIIHTDYLIKLLTNPKSFIRRNIVDQYLPYLNKKIYDYSRLLDSIHIAEINNDMSVSIEYMGGDVSYYTMSRGERFRIDIATTMAFRDLMKMMGKAVNVLFVDEVLDNSLDPHGTQRVFDLITSLTDTMFLISHRAEFETLVDDVMVITKRNGFSFIE